MRAVAALSFALFGAVRGVELTQDNWDTMTDGKTVFIKFLAPWWGHCKKMKPSWDKLMKEYEGSDSILVADVDCTADGKSKCNEVGVRGYPTIKYGDPSDLQDYSGSRELDGLKKFAAGLKPACSPKNIHLCDDEKKAKIEEFTNLAFDERAKMISEKEEEMQKVEADFKTFVDGLQKSYKEAMEKKDKDLEALKDSGLGLLKAVHTFAAKAKSEL